MAERFEENSTAISLRRTKSLGLERRCAPI